MEDVGVQFAQSSGEAVPAQVLPTELTEEQESRHCYPEAGMSHLILIISSLAAAELDDELIIRIRCVGRGKPLKHAGQLLSRTGV